MSKFDELKITDEESQDTVLLVNEPNAEIKVEKPKKITVFSMFVSAIKRECGTTDMGKNIPVPKYTLITFLLVLFIALLTSVFNYFIDKTLLLPLVMLLAAAAVPSVIMVFYAEINISRTNNALKMFFMIFSGIIVYVIMTLLKNKLFIRFMFERYIDIFVYPIMWTIAIALLISLFASIYKFEGITEYFLAAVAISCGFSFALSFHLCFSEMFTYTEIVFENGTTANLPVIINRDANLTDSINNILNGLCTDYLLMPYLFCCWSIMICSPRAFSIKRNNTKSTIVSYYALLALATVLYFLAEVDTNFVYFNYILKACVFFITSFISIKLTNSAVSLDLASTN